MDFQQTIPWDTITFGWQFVVNGGDLVGFPAAKNTAWNLIAATGGSLRYEPQPSPQWHSLPIDPEFGGGYLVLENVAANVTRGPRLWL